MFIGVRRVMVELVLILVLEDVLVVRVGKVLIGSVGLFLGYDLMKLDVRENILL